MDRRPHDLPGTTAASPALPTPSPSPEDERPPVSFTREDTPSAVVLAVAGEVDLGTEAELRRALGDALGDAGAGEFPVLVVDLAQVRFFGSTGAAALAYTHSEARRHGVELRVVTSEHSGAGRSLDLLGLSAYLPTHHSRVDALG